MHLPPEQTARFYRIWFALLHYVNDQRQLLDTFPATPGEATVSLSDAQQLRDVLWADDELGERFVAENPASLASADLTLVRRWQYRVAGTFYIVRHLKRYSVFLSTTTPSRAYGVLGLVSPIEEIVGPYLPIYVEAVLLPWDDQIIYDSLLVPYAISFGTGIRRSLNEAYRNAQEREGLLTTLLPPAVPATSAEVRQAASIRNSKILNAFRKELARTGLGANMVDQHVGNMTRFAQSVLVAQEPVRGLLELMPADIGAHLMSDGPKANPVSLKRFVQFLTATGRMDYDLAHELYEVLKRARR